MSADGWDTTELGRMSGQTFDVTYDPDAGVVRISEGGTVTEQFRVDADQWEQQAARELATRGYGARWNQWEPGWGGGRVMSVARTRFPDSDPGSPAAGGGGQDDDTSWESGAATYSAAAAEAPDTPPPAPYTPPELGRVRVYPQYTFPVYQAGVGGIGLDQEITVTDWDKQGRQWAEAEARRQVTEALGAPPNQDDTPGGAWWMGQGKKDEFRWQPVKGTPRSAKPNDGLPEPEPWRPWRPDETAETGTETGTGGETEAVPGFVQAARDRTARLQNEWVAEDEARVRADHAAGSPEPTVLSNGSEVTPEQRRHLLEQAGEIWPEGEERDISPAEYDRRVAEAAAAGTPFVLRPQDVKPGDQVLAGEELARVTGVDGDRVRIDYGYEKTLGVPGSRYSQMGTDVLAGGPLRKVPAGSTYASLEDRRPPAEQAARYAERRAHYEEHHGPGKRGKKGWTAHRRACRVCDDMASGGDGTGRRLHSVPPAPVPVPAPAETGPAGGETDPYPVKFTFTGDADDEIRHWRFEAALDALQDQVAAWRIPDDGSGVLDVDSFIASIGGYVQGLGEVLAQLGEKFASGETPVAPVVGETLADFAAALAVMAEESAAVYDQWQNNEDNAHDLRRARGEIPGAHLFNVAA